MLKNFRIKLKNLKAAELDELDYRKGERKDDEMKHCNVNKLGPLFIHSALEKLREEFKADNESLAQSEAISIMSLCDDLPHDKEHADGASNEAAGKKKNGKENV